MALLRITNGFERLSDAKLLERASFIHQQVSTRTSVFPTPSPTMPVLKDACDEFHSSLNAALSGDRVLVAQKNNLRQALVDLLHKLGYYVLFTAGGNRLVALESGFTLAKDPTSQSIIKPTGMRVSYGDQSGELTLSVKRVLYAVAYQHQYTTDPALKDESWQSMTPCSATKCKIPGLTPGTTYYFRVGAIGARDQVLYSDVVSKIAA